MIKKDSKELKDVQWVEFKDLENKLVFQNQYQHALTVINELIPEVIN